MLSATLNLVGTNKVALSDSLGRYQITHIPQGRYVLHVSYVGMKHFEQVVELDEGEVLQLPPIVLNTEVLKEVVVHTPAHTEESVSKVPLKRMDNPRVYTRIHSGLMRQQNIVRTEDALRNVAGVALLRSATGQAEIGAAYFALRGFPTQPTMLNGLPSITNGPLDPVNVERIDVIKGPASTLYGSALVGYGGLINIISKRPHAHLSAEGEFVMGTFGLTRLTMDGNVPLGHIAHRLSPFAIRINTAYHDVGSFQDAGFRKAFFLAPALNYAPSERMSIQLNTELSLSEMTSPTLMYINPFQPLRYQTPDALGYDPERAYTSHHVSIRTPALNFQGCMNYKLSSAWTSHLSVARSVKQSNGYHGYLWDEAHANEARFARYLMKVYSTTYATDIQQNFVGEHQTAIGHHRLLGGVDYLFTHVNSHNTDTVRVGSVNVRDRVYRGLTLNWVEAAFAESDARLKMTQAHRHNVGVYVKEFWTPIPAISLMVGVRMDYFYQTKVGHVDNQWNWSPKAGMVVRPLKDKVILFANYMSGFVNKPHSHRGDGSIVFFRPEQARQWETGVKVSLWDDNWTSDISYYSIQVRGVVRPHPERAQDFIQDGENRSQGIEWSLTGRTKNGWWIQGGYGYNLHKILVSHEEYVGRRPENAGPMHLANAWLSYIRPYGYLKGWGLAIGALASGKNAILNRKTPGTFTLPAYMRWDAAISYTGKIFEGNLKIDNITNQIYFVGWEALQPQMPRQFTARFAYRF